jgi:hypothetical protein
VPHESAGTASGVLSSVQQLGGALGVALIGVLFFGQVSGQAPTAVGAVSAQVTQDLRAAGVPPNAADEVATRFTGCFVDRSTADDPAAEPLSCRTVLDPVAPELRAQVCPRLAVLAEQAQHDDFAVAMRAGGLFQVLVFMTTAGLLFLLPGPARYRAQHQASRYRRRHRGARPRGPTPVVAALDAP